MALFRRLSLLPLMKAYHARSFATRVAVVPFRGNDIQDAVDNQIVDLDDTLDSGTIQLDLPVPDEDLDEVDLRAPPYRVFSNVDRRDWVATQDDSSVRFRMDMPGLCKEDVRVYLDDKKLVIRGKYPENGNKEEVDVIDEDNRGTYDAEIFLPDNVKFDAIRSEMKHGVLRVIAPKTVTNILVE